MKFRRHVPPPRDWWRWLRAVGARARRLVESARVKRLTHLLGTAKSRSVATWGGVLAGAFVVGYLIAAIFLFPAPLFTATISVPRLLGMSQAEATEVLENARLSVGQVESTTHPTAASGDVIWQDPPPGVRLEEGTAVRLTVSRGPQRVPVPDLAGYDVDLATRLAQAAGLGVRRVESQAPVPAGVLVNTRPPAGGTLSPGDTVTMLVSVGAPTITVPDLTGFTPEEAEAILQQVGLTLGTSVRMRSTAVPPGTVVQQDPAPGTLAAPGRAVDVTLARSP